MSGVTQKLEFTPEEAFVALAIIAVAVDGEQAEAEEMAVTQAILEAELFTTYPADQLITMINNAFNQIYQQGIETLFQYAVISLPENLRSEALMTVAKIVMADGKVSTEEKNLLTNLSQGFGVSEVEITQILQSV